MNRDWWRVALQSWAGGVSADLPALIVPAGVHLSGADGLLAVQGGAAVTLSAADNEGKHTATAA